MQDSSTQPAYTEAFIGLNKLLEKYQLLWREQPFKQHDCQWHSQYPALFSALQELTNKQVEEFENDPVQLQQWLKNIEPNLATDLSRAIPNLAQPVANDRLSSPAAEKFWHTGIPGRKWQQIKHFSHAITHQLEGSTTNIVDWCSGKGHLATYLHRLSQRPIHCLEIDKELCAAGKHNAEKYKLNIDFTEADALQQIDKKLLQQDQCHTSLHACGDLHISFLKQITHNNIRQLAFSPCCYHKIRDEHYHPLSEEAKQSSLQLDRNDLHLATEQVATGGKRTRSQRNTEQLWRLAFNHLYQQAYKTDAYLALPSCPKSLFNDNFLTFCHWAVTTKELDNINLKKLNSLNSQNDLDKHLNKAKIKLQEIRKLELVRKLFRRAMEMWLVFDKVLFLNERGYEVTVNEFCDQAITPRNFLISAHRQN